ncbi:MAG: FG-GAP repeat protein [Calditrichaceae bacterium]|nr:FG-GAP repeat protein [Calditrichaceae bacterium]RQV92028.1 MAG: T9SS C-terminal target domain-containing protein [Calditrichota bacterium]
MDNQAKKLIFLKAVLLIFIVFAVIQAQDMELLQFFPAKPTTDFNGSMLGSMIINIGDVNGDGYDDWAAGMLSAADINTSERTGKVYIYFSVSLPVNNAAPDRILHGEADGDYFGYSVASAGDVNNDGYDDVIVGAHANSTYTGKAYIYLGGAVMDYTADIVLSGESDRDYFGYSVSSAGDINHDNYDDVIIGATDAPGGGRAYIYLGGAEMDNTVDITLIAESAGDDFGYSVSGAGDINNDGNDDVIVGAWNCSENGNGSGSAYIYLCAYPMNTVPDVIIRGQNASDHLGYCVASAGNVNNDDYSDVIVSAQRSTNGIAYIHYGGVGMDNLPDVTLAPQSTGDYYGRSLSMAGDVNDDGYDDVLVAACRNETAGDNAGSVYLYFGGADMDSIPDASFIGEMKWDEFGQCISAGRDLNNDTYPDIIIGAPGNDEAGASAGKVYIYYGDENIDTTADYTYTGTRAGQAIGGSVSSAGDINNDGYDDIIVGAIYDGEQLSGQAYIYLGGSVISQEPYLILTGDAYQDKFGYSVACAGDVNGDDFDDVIVGAPENDDYGYNSGLSYVYFGGSMMDNSPDLILATEISGENFGHSVASAGDVNNDGYDDVVIGAPYSGDYSDGHVYVFYGGSSMNDDPDLLLNACDLEQGYSYFGISVSSAGDVNNDGYDDIIGGAYNSGPNDEGRAFIYYGGQTMDNVVDDTLTSVWEKDYFGYSVASAGDVNNDGYSDVIVGAYEAYDNGERPGRAYIYYGGQIIDKIPDAVFTGGENGSCFGYTVSSAGDVDKDGFDDVIIGAHHFTSDAGWDAGAAFLYLGAAVMNNTADAVFQGEAMQDLFGYSVACAGDVNGNGYADVIIGAHNNCNIGYNSGKAYVYGNSITSIPDNKDVIAPISYSLKQNYPNPFNASTRIKYTLPAQSYIKIVIYNTLGKEIAQLINQIQPAGVHSLSWNGKNNNGETVASGIYIYKMFAEDKIANNKHIEAKRLLLLK